MSLPLDLDETMVLQRTLQGQIALLMGSVDDQPAARQLLSVVNGYTPLAHLVRRLQAEHGTQATQAAVQHLVAIGHVKSTPPPSTALPTTAQWHWGDDEPSLHAC